MDLRRLILIDAMFLLLPISVFADAVVEGRVQLPESHAPPVMAKRYEIVTTGNVLLQHGNINVYGAS